jgi:hypothetical protein
VTHETGDVRQVIERVVDCPECHRACGWCAWYAKNARECGCGSQSNRKCAWGESLKGTVCALCGGTEKVKLVGSYERVEA